MKKFTRKDLDFGHIYCEACDLADVPLWYHTRGLQQTQSGYGRKLTSHYKIHFEGKLYRLYTTIFSNVGQNWFTVKGEKLFVN